MLTDIKIYHDNNSRRLVNNLFGARVADAAIAEAAGAFDKAIVHLTAEKQSLLVEIEHRFVEVQKRSFYVNQRRDLVLRNDLIRKSWQAPNRFGIKMFLAQVKAARLLGISTIATFAAGYPDHPNKLNGYYTWARFGFDAPLEDADLEEFPDRFVTARTLNDLMNLGGQKWWREFGYESNASVKC